MQIITILFLSPFSAGFFFAANETNISPTAFIVSIPSTQMSIILTLKNNTFSAFTFAAFNNFACHSIYIFCSNLITFSFFIANRFSSNYRVAN